MAGMDSTFSAAGSQQSNTGVGHIITNDSQNAGMGNPLGDKVDNSAGKNTLMENGFQGTFGKSTKNEYIQYNPNSFYPKS